MNADILIVDDSAILRMVTRRALAKLGVAGDRIFEAENGEEALDLLGCHRFDLILLDLHMPVMDGEEFAEAKAKDPDVADIPFVIVSTEANAGRLMRLVELGALGVMRKPFDPEDLRSLLMDYLPGDVTEAEDEQPEARRSSGDSLRARAGGELDVERLDQLIDNTLQQMTALSSETADASAAANCERSARITYSGASEEALVYISASDGFLREFSAQLLGMRPDDPLLETALDDSLKELANILAGELVVCLGGEADSFELGIPETCELTSLPAKEPSGACVRQVHGEPVELRLFRSSLRTSG